MSNDPTIAKTTPKTNSTDIIQDTLTHSGEISLDPRVEAYLQSTAEIRADDDGQPLFPEAHRMLLQELQFQDTSFEIDPAPRKVITEPDQDLLTNKQGWIIGSQGNDLLRVQTDKQMVTIGSIGGGKGRGVAIPNLLEHRGSVFSVEIGGATYFDTHKFRKHALGQQVYVIDPYGVTGEKSASVNLLATLDPESSVFTSDAKNFASSILKSANEKERDPFWKRAPEELLTALIIYVRTSPDVAEEDRNLSHVAKLLSQYPRREWFDLMREFSEDVGEYHDDLRTAGGKMEDNNPTTLGIVHYIGTALPCFRTKQIAAVNTTTSFSLADLREKKISVYVVMPKVEDYISNAAWLRLLLERSFAACPNPGDAGRNFRHNDRILFMLDEFTNLGKIDAVTSAIQTVRQKGITIWTLLQSLGQLHAVYGEKDSSAMLGAAGCTQVFNVGPTDAITSEAFAKMLGRRTVYKWAPQMGISGGKNFQATDQIGVGKSVADGTLQQHAVTDGTTSSDTDTDTTSVQTSTGSTKTTGTNENIDTSPNNILGMPTTGYKGGAKMHNFLHARAKNYGRNNSESVQETKMTGSAKAHSHQEGRNHAKTDTAGTNHTETLNATRNISKAVGAQEGWQRSGTFQPVTEQGVDGAELVKIIGNNRKQLIMLGTKERTKNMIAELPYYDLIPELRCRAYGEFSRDVILHMPQEQKLLPAPAIPLQVTQQIIYLPAQERFSHKEQQQPGIARPLTTQTKANSADARTPVEYVSAVQAFRTALKSRDAEAISTTQEHMYETFLRAAASIDIEASRITAWFRKQVGEVHRDEAVASGHIPTLAEQVQILRTAQRTMEEKAARIADLQNSVIEQKTRFFSEVELEKLYVQAIDEYRDYLKNLLIIAKKWHGIYAPARPQKIEGGNSNVRYRVETIQNAVNQDTKQESFTIPAINLSEPDVKTVSSFDPAQNNTGSPELEKKINNEIVAIKRNRTADIMTVQRIVREKQAAPFLTRLFVGYGNVGFIGLRKLKYIRDQKVSKLQQHTDAYVQQSVSAQQTLSSGIQGSNTSIKKNLEKMWEYRENIAVAHRMLATIDGAMDEHFAYLRGEMTALKEATEMLKNLGVQTCNDLENYPEWEELERHGVKFGKYQENRNVSREEIVTDYDRLNLD